MKRLFLLSVLSVFSVFATAADEKGLSAFNSTLMNNIDSVMKDNAYKYQKGLAPKKRTGRFPASVQPILEESELHEKQEETLIFEK